MDYGELQRRVLSWHTTQLWCTHVVQPARAPIKSTSSSMPIRTAATVWCRRRRSVGVPAWAYINEHPVVRDVATIPPSRIRPSTAPASARWRHICLYSRLLEVSRCRRHVFIGETSTFARMRHHARVIGSQSNGRYSGTFIDFMYEMH